MWNYAFWWSVESIILTELKMQIESEPIALSSIKREIQTINVEKEALKMDWAEIKFNIKWHDKAKNSCEPIPTL